MVSTPYRDDTHYYYNLGVTRSVLRPHCSLPDAFCIRKYEDTLKLNSGLIQQTSNPFRLSWLTLSVYFDYGIMFGFVSSDLWDGLEGTGFADFFSSFGNGLGRVHGRPGCLLDSFLDLLADFCASYLLETLWSYRQNIQNHIKSSATTKSAWHDTKNAATSYFYI